MSWQAASLDTTGWNGTRQWRYDDVVGLGECRRYIMPRLNGGDELRLLLVKLNDCCAKNPTPYFQMLMRNGMPGKDLADELEDIIGQYNVDWADKGIRMKLVVYGLANFVTKCSGVMRGDQPEFWIKFDILSDRLMQENRDYDAKINNEPQPQDGA